MENISKELEEKIKELVKQNNIVAAISLVMQELKLGMKDSKDIVDRYR
jgi:hypothetical protein